MTSILLCAGAFFICLLAGNRSLKQGLFAVIAVGYVYGILRANLPDLWTYLMFDAGVIGLYCAQLWRPLTHAQRIAAQDLKLWLVALITWPTLLFILSPSPEPLVELVGLRANIFLLPFLLLGARLSYDDVGDLALYLAVLNLGAVGLATLEFFIGLAPFFPVNEVTEIIYKSKDLVGRTAYRIPSSFSSAHAFAGTLVMTLPLLVGAWSQHRGERWQTPLLASAIVASLVGIFMAAARTHMITAVLLVAVVTISGQLRGRLWVKWALVVGLVAYVVAGDARFQRFTTLQDTDRVAERLAGSVNEGFFDLVGEHPLGRGLASGGTSVPYFLRADTDQGLVMENEYARIGLEQGLPGLGLWVLFIVWVLTRRPSRAKDDWLLARRMAWVSCAAVFGSGLLGMGMLSSVPQTVLMLTTVGWMVVFRQRQPAVADAVVPARTVEVGAR
jgi:hypothetical protein